jgi:hypothetical protein
MAVTLIHTKYTKRRLKRKREENLKGRNLIPVKNFLGELELLGEISPMKDA